MKTIAWRIPIFGSAALMFSSVLAASVLEAKTLIRSGEAVVLTGTKLPAYYGLSINNTDATMSPNQIFAWAYDSATGWRQVVFQIDEVNNANPASPPPTCTGGYNVGQGPNHMQADDGLWDSNDELVFMCEESGDRVTQDAWAPGAVTTAARYEITLTDPLDTSKKGWVYIFRHDTLPAWRTDDYIDWNETTNIVGDWNGAADAYYSVAYPSSHASALYFTNLNVTVAGGGTTANMVQKSRWYWYGGFALSCGSSETQIRTEQTITGGSCGTMVLPWYAKDGRVRVLRYFIWSPYCTWVSNGIGMWPSVHHYYYKSYWQEDHNDKFHGGSGHTDYWWSTINHSSATTMTFYDSNGETRTIDGTADTAVAATPLWTWYQVSSSYGSYVKILRDTAKLVSPDNRKNLYTDSGTTRGDAGYHIENPSETFEEAWDHFYYFFLPANAPNQGADYSARVNSPLTSASTSQAYATPPEFSGIQTAVDYSGACVDQGVQVTWTAITNWNDGCSSSCTSRKYEIYRNGTKIYTETNAAATSWVDTTGVNGTSYNYGVEACSQTGVCTTLGNTLATMDFVAAAPQVSVTATTATDLDGCAASGIQVTWSAPADWKDNGSGSRQYDLYWDQDAYAAPIATNIISPATYAAPAGVAHTYKIKAVNGCSLSTFYDASAAATDAVASDPTAPAIPAISATDNNACSRSGITVLWNPVLVWGDGGAGSRKYDVYSSSNGFTSPVAANATSPAIVTPADSALYTYRVVATNGCGRTFTYVDAQVADGQVAPNFAGIQNVADGSICSTSALTITWTDVNGDGPEGWNDGGSGPGTRIYRIYRNGAEIANSPKVDGITSTTDIPPSPNAAYDYTVRAYNLKNCYTDGGVTFSGTDSAGATPTASPGQTVAVDPTCDAGSGVDITWDAVTDWGDHGYNTSGRFYRVYYSGDGYKTAISPVLAEGTTAFAWNAPDNMAFRYRVTARNGCSNSKVYIASGLVTDKNSCEPTCTLKVDDDFTAVSDPPDNDFGESCDGGKNYWTLMAGVGNGGTRAWQMNLPSTNGDKNQSASLELTTPAFVPWTTDVKLRFWSSCAFQSDDAGIVEIWTNDSSAWRKVAPLNYPTATADVPASMILNCASDVVAGLQPAFQGAVAGYYEARLDSYLTPSTTQINLRFKGASGAVRNASSWVIDDVKLGYGITDPVFYWSVDGDLSLGVVRSGNEAVFNWEDNGLYQVTEWRLYKSAAASSMRTSGSIVHTQADTDAPLYTWTTSDGAPLAGACWFYKIYGFKEPCGESNQGEN